MKVTELGKTSHADPGPLAQQVQLGDLEESGLSGPRVTAQHSHQYCAGHEPMLGLLA